MWSQFAVKTKSETKTESVFVLQDTPDLMEFVLPSVVTTKSEIPTEFVSVDPVIQESMEFAYSQQVAVKIKSEIPMESVSVSQDTPESTEYVLVVADQTKSEVQSLASVSVHPVFQE